MLHECETEINKIYLMIHGVDFNEKKLESTHSGPKISVQKLMVYSRGTLCPNG